MSNTIKNTKSDTKILVVEDDTTLSNGIKAAFKGNDYTFTQCGTICEAEDSLSSGPFDLILLDINLPDGNGVEFCQKLRNEENDTH